jgi:disulfide oxidoreductase YuzD
MVDLYVYGADQVCPSCVSFPSSKETASWLSHALERKYGKQVAVHYVDIYSPAGEEQVYFAKKVLDEDLWYPVVVIQNEVIAEGNPKLKTICERLEKLGLGKVIDYEATN